MCERRVNTVRSTSAGRLFDAVSAILDICRSSTYEGEAAEKLQFAAEQYIRPELPVEMEDMTAPEKNGRELFYLPTDKLVKYIAEQKCRGELPQKLAYLFHMVLGRQITEGCKVLSAKNGIKCCALSGGVFQNKLLLQICKKGLSEAGFTVLTHSVIPPNDGGIALGQAVAAMEYLKRGHYEYRDGKRNHWEI